MFHSPSLFSALLATLLLVAASQSVQAQSATRLTFEHLDVGHPKRVEALMTADNVRVDRPWDRFAVIYQDKGEAFIGLELRDGKFWRFRWPDVKAAVAETERAKQKLGGMDWGDGFASYDLEQPWQKADTIPQDQYAWTRTQETGTKLLGYPVTKWLGKSPTGPEIVAWAASESDGKLAARMDRLRRMNEPLELAAVRGFLPKGYFIAAQALGKQGWVPLEVLIGSGPEKGRERVTLKGIKDAQANAGTFVPPSNFRETQLLALEGIFQEVPQQKKPQSQNIFERGELQPTLPSAR